jgi:group I intron endonuclease
MAHEHLYINELTMPMSKDIGYIYKITSPTNRVYVGQTNNINRRINDYTYRKTSSQKLLHKSLEKYGFKNHKFEILDEVSPDNIHNAEKFYISICESYRHHHKNGLNLTMGGEGTAGRVLSAETRAKMSKSQKGRTCSDETRKKISEANKGKIPSVEARRKISAANKGRKMSQSNLDALKKANTGIVRTQEQKDKIRNTLTGTKLTQEHKNKISLGLMGREYSDNTIKKISESNIKTKNTPENLKRQSILSKAMWDNPEYRAKIINANKNKVVSEETKEKIRLARKNQIFTQEQEDKKSNKMKELWGDPIFRENMINARKLKKNKKQEQCTETI